MEISTRTYGAELMGPLNVKLAGVERRDPRGNPIASVNTPTEGEATAALTRAARVRGADGVIGVGSDYRRLTVAGGGPLNASATVIVQAWGTAVRR